MNDETNLILKVIEEHGEKNDLQIKAVQVNMEAGFNLLADRMNDIAKQKKIQNGRVDKLEKITKLNRLIVDYPRLAIIIIILILLGLPELISLIPFAELIKKIF